MSAAGEMAQDMPPVSPVVRVLRPAIAAILTISALAWAADLYRRAGFMFLSENFLAFALGLGIALVYLHFPLRRGDRRGPLPWYDALAATAGLGAGLYVAIHYDRIVMQFFTMPLDGLIAAALLIGLSVEGLRRSAGIALPIILCIFVAYAMVGHLVPGALQARPVQMQNLVLYLGIDASGIFGIVMMVAVTVVIPYVFFGQLLLNSGATNFFNDISVALMGRYRGGSAKISITASGMFGSISGVVVSNILATGVITIGLMKRAGFTPRQAAAIEATASTGGQMMPPIMGAVAFLMADMLQRPYQDVVIAAIIPSLLYFSALFIQADLEAARRGIDRVPEEEIPRTRDALRSGWIYLLPFVLLVVGLFRWNWRPEYAAIYASLTVLVLAMTIGYRGQRMTLRQVWSSITGTGIAALEILMIAVAAGCIMGILQLTGLGFALTMLLVQLGAGNLIAILMIAAVMCIVLGMGMPTLGVYVLLAVLVAPSLIEVGIDPMAAHMFILYLGMMSMITPPIAVGAFFAATLAGSEPMRTGFTAMKFGWTAYIIPFLFVFSPGLLLQGGLDLGTVVTIVSALAGVWFISAAFAGYGLSRLDGWQRLPFGLAGAALIMPLDLVEWAIWAQICGLALALGLVWHGMLARRNGVGGARRERS